MLATHAFSCFCSGSVCVTLSESCLVHIPMEPQDMLATDACILFCSASFCVTLSLALVKSPQSLLDLYYYAFTTTDLLLLIYFYACTTTVRVY